MAKTCSLPTETLTTASADMGSSRPGDGSSTCEFESGQVVEALPHQDVVSRPESLNVNTSTLLPAREVAASKAEGWSLSPPPICAGALQVPPVLRMAQMARSCPTKNTCRSGAGKVDRE